MLSLILTSRVKGNEDSDIFKLLDSLVECGGTTDNCEVLVKYDNDDDHSPVFTDASPFLKYPFKVKTFTWSRGEGRHGFHLDHFTLFTERSPESKFVLLCADDFTFTRKGFIEDILSIESDYCFVGANRPRMEMYKGQWQEPHVMEIWKHNEGVCLPCMSARTLEVLQNYGWQCNGDNWQTLLVILMYESYNMDLWKSITHFYDRSPTKGNSGYGETYNRMEMDGSRNPENKYYFKLVMQQAKNLFLNISFDEYQRQGGIK